MRLGDPTSWRTSFAANIFCSLSFPFLSFLHISLLQTSRLNNLASFFHHWFLLILFLLSLGLFLIRQPVPFLFQECTHLADMHLGMQICLYPIPTWVLIDWRFAFATMLLKDWQSNSESTPWMRISAYSFSMLWSNLNLRKTKLKVFQFNFDWFVWILHGLTWHWLQPGGPIEKHPNVFQQVYFKSDLSTHVPCYWSSASANSSSTVGKPRSIRHSTKAFIESLSSIFEPKARDSRHSCAKAMHSPKHRGYSALHVVNWFEVCHLDCEVDPECSYKLSNFTLVKRIWKSVWSYMDRNPHDPEKKMHFFNVHLVRIQISK